MGNIMDDWFGINPPPKPKIPDPTSTADTQQQYNAEQARQQAQYNLDALRTNISANRLDQSTPFMNINYSQTGVDAYGNPTYGVNTSYSPEQQALLDLLQGNQQGLGQFGSSLISDLASNPIYNQGNPDFTSMMNPLMERHLAIMNPYYSQQKDKLDNDLRNQGLFPGMPGYDNAMRTLLQTQSESVGQFANQSIPTLMSMYEQPFNIIRGIMGATSPVSMPNLGVQAPPTQNLGAPTVGNVNYSGITSDALKAELAQYENEYKQYADSINAIGTIAGTVLGAPTGTFMGNAVGGAANGLAGMLGISQSGNNGGVLPLFRSPTPTTRPTA